MSTTAPATQNHRNAMFVPTIAAIQRPHHLNQQSHKINSQSAAVYTPQPTTPPRTPQKPNHNSNAKNAVASGTESASKPRSKGKSRQKNVMTSPAVAKNDRNTPPLTGMQSTGPTFARPTSTPSTTAYAGPTFHASPAPSALPIPSFFSKSIPESPSTKALQAQEQETLSNGSDSPTPLASQILAVQTKREESPLDVFFKADREEKARARSTSSFRGSGSESGPFQPPLDSPQSAHNTPPPDGERRNRTTHFSSGSSSAMFAMELDGNSNPRQPYGPAFSTPYNERINAAQNKSYPPKEPQQATDRSEALKAYLFSGQVKPPMTSNSASPNSLTTVTATPGTLSRNKSGSAGGPGNAVVNLRQAHNNFPFVNESSGVQNSFRGTPRASGLRQQVNSTKTPYQTPDQLPGVYADPSTPSRAPKADFLPREFEQTHGATGSGPDFPLQNSGTPPGTRNAEFKDIEDSLRRILKIEPLSKAAADESVLT